MSSLTVSISGDMPSGASSTQCERNRLTGAALAFLPFVGVDAAARFFDFEGGGGGAAASRSGSDPTVVSSDDNGVLSFASTPNF